MRVFWTILVILGSAAAFAGLDAALPEQPVAAKGTLDVLQGKIEKSNQEMSSLKEQIQSFRNQEKEIDNRESAIKRTHEEVINEIELSRSLLGEMVSREQLLIQQSKELENELAAGRKKYEASQLALSSHLRSMYIRGRQGKLESILTSGSFSTMVTRLKWDDLMVRLGAGLVDDTRHEGTQISSRHKQLKVALAEIWTAREDVAEESEHMEELLAEQTEALRTLQGERQQVRDRLLELSMNEQRLSYVLSDLEELRSRREIETQSSTNQLTEMAGQLEWPARGALLRDFGRSVHPQFQTVTLNNGINIAAKLGAPVAAVALGTVEYSDRLPGFGQCVILDHGAGYYTLYAHLDRVFVSASEEIASGQVIAEVGRPQASEPSQLYFEIRHGKTPLDPMDWLRSR
ncbi:MAG: peptidoglycan DD-metalloendopeptidase family protein [bacterium]|nr:peptidoglycan DD-metalloendopeptidase family protein [bacterium]